MQEKLFLLSLTPPPQPTPHLSHCLSTPPSISAVPLTPFQTYPSTPVVHQHWLLLSQCDSYSVCVSVCVKLTDAAVTAALYCVRITYTCEARVHGRIQADTWHQVWRHANVCLSGFVSVCLCVSMSYRGLGILGTLTELDCPRSRIGNPPVVSQEIWKLDKLKVTSKFPSSLDVFSFLEVIRLK